jgi:superfamily II DNA or RNA helicase
MNNQTKGYLYEIQIRDYIINVLNKPAYLWNDVPETILLQNNIIGSHNAHRITRKQHKLNKVNPLQDTGIDVIQLEENKCSLIQCKNGYMNGLRMEDLAGFNAWMVALDTLTGYVYYTDKLSQNIACLPKNKRIKYIKQPFDKDVVKKTTQIIYKPYDYQVNASNNFIKHFAKNNRGILSMPCGTGKTMTSYLISNKYKQIIILSPLKQFAKQNLDRYTEYGYKNNTLLIDSDGERDIKQIKKFIQSNKSFLISSTFCSVNCIQQILKYCSNPLIIIDEFHNLSKNNVTNEEDDFYKILNSDHLIMFMSATPRVYELEDVTDDTDHIFGDTFYNMTFTEAIEKKFITDYKIWLPALHEDNTKLNKELSIYEIDDTIKAKCKFFFSCMLNNGSKKCIIYCQDTKEINIMSHAMNKLNDYFCVDYTISQITASNTEKQRTKILNDFATNSNIQLLFSVRILDECVDIPTCDSIFITYPTKAKIRTIQRLCRCIRTNKLNKFKIGNIYIWCEEYDKILETLSGIKEYDIFFKDKIKINSIDFHDGKKKKGVELDNKLLQKYIVGIKEFRQISWNEKLEMVKKYMDTNDKRPSEKDVYNKTKKLGTWISTQQKNHKTKQYIMSNSKIYDDWTTFINDEKYNKYFISNEDNWISQLDVVKKYINENNKRPARYGNNETKILGAWISTQQTAYKTKKQIMSNSYIYDKWTAFINDNKYKKYFMSNEDNWISQLDIVKKYINENDKKPSKDGNNKTKILGSWISTQQNNYKSKQYIMSNSVIYDIWTVFINDNKYKKYFMSNENVWKQQLTDVKKYIDVYDKRPSTHDNKTKILGQWITTQQKNYKTKKQIMSDTYIYDRWTSFITDAKYKKYFETNSTL